MINSGKKFLKTLSVFISLEATPAEEGELMTCFFMIIHFSIEAGALVTTRLTIFWEKGFVQNLMENRTI